MEGHVEHAGSELGNERESVNNVTRTREGNGEGR